MKKGLVLVVLAMVAALAFALVGCGGGRAFKGENYEITNQEVQLNDDRPCITGVFKYTGTNPANKIIIKFLVYDNGKNKIGESVLYIKDIRQNETREFKSDISQMPWKTWNHRMVILITTTRLSARALKLLMWNT